MCIISTVTREGKGSKLVFERIEGGFYNGCSWLREKLKWLLRLMFQSFSY